MAVRNLVEDECGRLASLIQLSSHFVIDHAHNDDDLNCDHLCTNNNTNNLVKEFLGEICNNFPQTFCMDSLLQEIQKVETAFPDPKQSVISAWKENYLASEEKLKEECLWNDIEQNSSKNETEQQTLKSNQIVEMVKVEPVGDKEYWYQQPKISPDFEERINLVCNMVNTYEPGVHEPTYSHMKLQFGDNIEMIQSEFLQTDEELTHQQSLETFQVNEKRCLEYPEVVKESTMPISLSDMHDHRQSSDLWMKLTESWQKILNQSYKMHTSDFSEYFDPYKNYPLQHENPMLGQEGALEEGKRRLELGDLVGAVLCFEAAVQGDAKNSEAWQLLGLCQAENEQDPQAIAALKVCLKLDPGNLTALMAIAVSYTNESYPYHAFHFLKLWLCRNEKYSHLVPKTDNQPPQVITSYLSGHIHQEVQDLFISAARLHPKNDIDPDVQCGLGVLFNLSHEYSKAIDCFRAALSVRPNDHKLWNKLGATLANGNKSEEAVEAYHRALVLYPGFVRARYNLGVTCLNLSAYREAAEHLLSALNLQAQVKGDTRTSMSNNIWRTLRLVMSMQNQKDLCKYVDERNLIKLNEVYDMD